MLSPENPAFSSFSGRFEATPTYEDLARVPQTVVAQTDSMVSLSSAGIVSSDTVRNYMLDYTVPFLRSAVWGVERVYRPSLATFNSLPVDVNEAADFTNVVFSWMHYFDKSDYLPLGFARRGMLRAPQNSKEFISRILEIRWELPHILYGNLTSEITPNTEVAGFRAYTFFKVGKAIPLKFMESDRERKEHEQYVLENMSKDVDTSFLS